MNAEDRPYKQLDASVGTLDGKQFNNYTKGVKGFAANKSKNSRVSRYLRVDLVVPSLTVPGESRNKRLPKMPAELSRGCSAVWDFAQQRGSRSATSRVLKFRDSTDTFPHRSVKTNSVFLWLGAKRTMEFKLRPEAKDHVEEMDLSAGEFKKQRQKWRYKRFTLQHGDAIVVKDMGRWTFSVPALKKNTVFEPLTAETPESYLVSI